jgi:hypothetical protein
VTFDEFNTTVAILVGSLWQLTEKPAFAGISRAIFEAQASVLVIST